MIHQTLRREGDEYVVTIPREELERLGLRAGQELAVRVEPRASEELAPEVEAAFERSWKRNEAGYRYLAGR